MRQDLKRQPGLSSKLAGVVNGNLKTAVDPDRVVSATAESGSACGTSGTGNGVDDDSDGVKDDGCPSVLYAYDNLHRLSSQKDALGNTWSYTYDAAGRLSTRTDAKSQQVTLVYNNRGDVTSIDYPSGTTDVSFQYDAVRNRTQMVDATGTTTYNYDAVSRPTSVVFPASRTVSYTYSNVGNPATVTHLGSNTVTYGYDEAHNLTSASDWNSQQTTYAGACPEHRRRDNAPLPATPSPWRWSTSRHILRLRVSLARAGWSSGRRRQGRATVRGARGLFGPGQGKIQGFF